jgi:hypothetical protein
MCWRFHSITCSVLYLLLLLPSISSPAGHPSSHRVTYGRKLEHGALTWQREGSRRLRMMTFLPLVYSSCSFFESPPRRMPWPADSDVSPSTPHVRRRLEHHFRMTRWLLP